MTEEKIYKTVTITYPDIDLLQERREAMRNTMMNYINRGNKYILVDENISIGNNRYYLNFKLQLVD